MKIKLMSHNVWGMYAPDVFKKVANRAALMKKVYFEYLPDAIGMQEYSEDIVQNRLPELLLEHYCQVDLSAEIAAYGMKQLFTPVFYNPDVLEVRDKGFVLFDRAYNNSDSKGAAYAVFCHRASGWHFTLCNTHYWWKGGVEHSAARVENSKEILKLKAKLPEAFFVMGDFNCRIDSPEYQTLLSGGLCDAQSAARQSTDSNTHHAYPEYDAEKNIFYGSPKPDSKYAHAIDHILVDAAHAEGMERFDIIISDDACNSSDHCPVWIEYYYGK